MDANLDTQPIDFDSALERTGGDEEFLFELLDMYIEDFIHKFPQLKSAVETMDSGLILELAHGLKGSSANLSLAPLQDLLYQIEMTGRENKADKAGQYLLPLEKEFERLLAALKDKNSSQL